MEEHESIYRKRCWNTSAEAHSSSPVGDGHHHGDRPPETKHSRALFQCRIRLHVHALQPDRDHLLISSLVAFPAEVISKLDHLQKEWCCLQTKGGPAERTLKVFTHTLNWLNLALLLPLSPAQESEGLAPNPARWL